LDQYRLLDNTNLVLVLGPMLIFALVWVRYKPRVGIGIRQVSDLVLLPQVPYHAGIGIRLLALHQVISNWCVLQKNQYSLPAVLYTQVVVYIPVQHWNKHLRAQSVLHMKSSATLNPKPCTTFLGFGYIIPNSFALMSWVLRHSFMVLAWMGWLFVLVSSTWLSVGGSLLCKPGLTNGPLFDVIDQHENLSHHSSSESLPSMNWCSR